MTGLKIPSVLTLGHRQEGNENTEDFYGMDRKP